MTSLDNKTRAYLVSLLAGGLCGGLAVGAFAHRLEHMVPAPAAAIGATAVLLLACAAAIPVWRQIDEVAREAQQSAWYWGGSIGICFAIGLAVFAYLSPPTQIIAGLAALTVNGAFAAGLVACVLIQMAAFLIGWAIWWASKR